MKDAINNIKMAKVYASTTVARTWTVNSYLCDASTSKGYNNSHNVDSKLELKKLGNAVIDISAPHNCFHNAAEIIISEDDIWSFLGHIRTGYTLKE